MAFAQYDVHNKYDCEKVAEPELVQSKSNLTSKRMPPQPDEEKQSAHSVDWQSTKKSVLERNRHMFNNSDMSDISFTCEGSGKKFYAHKYVLGTSSAVFRAMFYGDLAEKNSVVHLRDTDVKSLEEFLRFLYTDECNLTTHNVVSVMYLSKKYIVPSLTEKCVNNLASSIKAENVMSILEQATHFDERKLEMSCWEFIKSNTKQAVASTDFNNISQKTLASLLRRNELNIVEVELFRAVLKWSDFQCSTSTKNGDIEENGETRRTDIGECSKKDNEVTKERRRTRRSVIGDAIYDLRFLAMTQREFAQNVATSGLLTAEEMIPIYNKFNGIDSRNLKWKLSGKRSLWLYETDCIDKESESKGYNYGNEETTKASDTNKSNDKGSESKGYNYGNEETTKASDTNKSNDKESESKGYNYGNEETTKASDTNKSNDKGSEGKGYEYGNDEACDTLMYRYEKGRKGKRR
ncbi:BTB POZ domain-containing 6 isoform X2 [Paramuricea clavata]|uniref:BTB POZ domain-containing 6 isoform X2 n=1 Tax=Paramuricea clavata TaxID=317549 RepID=A0A7D9IFX7_PARCT|nr:BTB POZ domain-containing 6 isoform X2 [Paramuricea clavata]